MDNGLRPLDLLPAWRAHEYLELCVGVVSRLVRVLLVNDILDNRVGVSLPLFCQLVEKNRLGENLRETDVFTHWALWWTGALWAVCFATLSTTQPPHLPFIEK